LTSINAGGDSRTNKFESKATNISNGRTQAGSISNSPKKREFNVQVPKLKRVSLFLSKIAET
jgi:hypothetical protein